MPVKPLVPRNFDLLVFDWDGTLMDSAAAIAASLQSACRDLDLPVPSEDQARYVIGLGLNDAMAHILPRLDPSRYPDVVARYRVHFLERDARTTLFPGVADAIGQLRDTGFLLAVATGKSRRGLDRALAATGLKPYFHATRCADEGHSKPHPGMLQGLMSELGASPDRTLMIGDTTHDMEMARAAGAHRLGVTYGAHAREALLGCAPASCVDDFAGVRQWLARHA
jgi:phosphoglycolate phosphatase